MKIKIKQTRQQDLADIAYLFDAYRVFYKQVSDYDLALKFITERFENKESVIFYAINEEGDYLGFTQLFPNFSSVSAQRSWILNDLFVSPDLRSPGIGTLLLNKAKEHAIQTRTKGIGLKTPEDNVRAQALYESLGYTRNSEFAYYYKAKNVSEFIRPLQIN